MPRVTGTQRAVEHAGRDDELAYQEMLKGLELKRDMEAILVGTNWAVAYLNGRRMVSIPLARTGDSERRQMLSEYALVARNEKSSGGVFDNTTS